MSIINTYTNFRWRFAQRLLISGDFTFADANPDTIARAAGSYVADGVKVGMTVQPIGSASNDGKRFTAAVVAAGTLTLAAEDAVVAEGPTTSKLQVIMMAPDGYEEWPGYFAGQAGRTNLVRANGFSGGFGSVPSSIFPGVNTNFTVNAFAADAVAGVDEYDWFLSQRTEDAAKKWLAITSYPGLLPNTYSGSVAIDMSAQAFTELGLSSNPLSVDQIIEIFRFCYLYCRRRSDGAIQGIDLLKAILHAS